MKKLYKKYAEVINYLIFGVLTTIVSIGSYYILSIILDLENSFLFIIANIISWILAVSFAFITNRLFVFKSKGKKRKEFCKFIFSRILTLLLEVIGMYLLVKIIGINNMISKVLIQIIVIVLNYILSKVLVFKN